MGMIAHTVAKVDEEAPHPLLDSLERYHGARVAHQRPRLARTHHAVAEDPKERRLEPASQVGWSVDR